MSVAACSGVLSSSSTKPAASIETICLSHTSNRESMTSLAFCLLEQSVDGLPLQAGPCFFVVVRADDRDDEVGLFAVELRQIEAEVVRANSAS